jgi:cytoplasmic iron level regulating protein YaaA (DUF328/UPF0246 family)
MARPAIFFISDGDVYTGLDAYSIPKVNWRHKDSLRILSGLYGYPKPWLMQAFIDWDGNKVPGEK